MSRTAAPRLIGRGEELDVLAAALSAGRHVLIEGPHGVGKSLLVAQVCAAAGTRPVIVHGSSALTASALVGGHDPSVVLRRGYARDAFLAGPLVAAMHTGRVLYIDEANRVPADVVNALISAMSEAMLVVPRFGPVRAESGFRVVASVNPLDGVGTSALPAAFLDRAVRLALDYQNAADERAIVRARVAGAQPALVVRAVYAVRASRGHPDVRVGSSIRGAIDLVSIASFLARLDVDDAGLDAALLSLSSKIVLRSGVDRTVESVIRELWADAIISEHRAADRPGLGETSGEPLPPSSVELAGEDEREACAPDTSSTARIAQLPSEPSASGRGSVHGGALDSGQGAGPESEVATQTRQALAAFVRSSGRQHGAGWARTARAAISRDLTDVERLAATIVVHRVRGVLPVSGQVGGRFATVRYNFRSDDLDLDRTIAELVETPAPTSAHLWVHDRVPRRRGVVLMLDASGSMRGDRAIESATAAAASALALERDELAVVAFGTGAEVLKRGEETVPAPELARRVLALRPHGLTDLSAGLEAGLGLLATMQSPVKVAVVMTDGVQNKGVDARVLAARYQRLDVLATTDSPWRLRHCQALAAAGRGRCLRYDRLDRLPATISQLLNG
ncbi:MAG TPA: AAA family ATPase [Pseudonocardiaceae bacterium]